MICFNLQIVHSKDNDYIEKEIEELVLQNVEPDEEELGHIHYLFRIETKYSHDVEDSDFIIAGVCIELDVRIGLGDEQIFIDHLVNEIEATDGIERVRLKEKSGLPEEERPVTKLQIIHSNEEEDYIHSQIEEKVRKHLENELYEYDGNPLDIYDLFTVNIQYSHNIKESNLSILGIGLSREEEIEIVNERAFIISLINDINSIEGIKNINKFVDLEQREEYLQLYKQIYDLEQDLREVLTFIFRKRYGLEEDLLQDYNVSITKDFEPKDLENKFFGLSFSDYQKLCSDNNLKYHSKVTDLIKEIKNTSNFEDFVGALNSKGIIQEQDASFLASIRNDLDSLEKMRNNVMHNRSYSIKTYNNFSQSFEQLKEKIKEYWGKVNTEE